MANNIPANNPAIRLDAGYLQSCMDIPAGELFIMNVPIRKRIQTDEQRSATEAWTRIKPAYERLLNNQGNIK